MSIFLEPFLDHFPPVVDVRGALADLQIRPPQLEELAKELSAFWPQVSSVDCGFRKFKPYFIIHIDPFSYESQEKHWALHEKIRYHFRLDRFESYVLAKTTSELPSYLLEIYSKQ